MGAFIQCGVLGLWLLLAVGCTNTTPRLTSLPPPAAVPAKLPAKLADALPRNDAGLPVLITSEAIELSFDESLDDPVARWGECVSRVTGCYRVNGKRPVTGCIDLIDKCADETGGIGCCPSGCVAEFHAAVDKGRSEDDAVSQSFLKGDCVQGLALQLNRVQP